MLNLTIESFAELGYSPTLREIQAGCGLRSLSATRASVERLEVVHALGGGRSSLFFKVRLRSALPGLLSGLRVAAPAALLGAIVGEFLGGEHGLGVAMVTSQNSLNVSRTWGLAVVATALALGSYLITATIDGRVNRCFISARTSPSRRWRCGTTCSARAGRPAATCC